jgi:uncharacterized YigZ family protein
VAAADSHRVPGRTARAELRVRGSRFLAVASPAGAEADALAEVEALRRAHHDATHVAFAWRLGSPDGGVRTRASDAGEPAGTAGRPILAAIEAGGLVDALVVVVRWFGGTKLGTGGLARAYGDAAAAALAAAGTTIRYDRVRLALDCPYDRVPAVKRLIGPPEVLLVAEEFGASARFELAVRRSRVDVVLARLADARVSATRLD